jgi:hypothetical protein
MFHVVTGAAVFLGWTIFDPPGTYEINSAPERAGSQDKRFWFRWNYMDGLVAGERLAVDLDRPFVCSTCLYAFAGGKMGGTVYRILVLIALERLILPLWFLAAFAAWKIGRAIAARHRGQTFLHIGKNDAVRHLPPYSRDVLFVLLGGAACWLGYNLNWARQRHVALQEAGILLRSWNTVGAPWSLRWLGELGVAEILVREGSEQRLRDLFPESRLVSESEWRAWRAENP